MENNGVVVEVFSEEDLRNISGVVKGDEFVEVTCGCTSKKYGDAVGRLRVYVNGELEIKCECLKGCPEDKLSPSAFEKHSRRETARKWKNNIWVILDGEKVPLRRTKLLKYYDRSSKSTNGSRRPIGKQSCHRDEFVQCTRCHKERRFHRRTSKDCRRHHDASANPNWTCADHPNGKVSCEDDEERASRKILRTCPRIASCNGCLSCVCTGCNNCRFSDCSCQTCNDFIRNQEME